MTNKPQRIDKIVSEVFNILEKKAAEVYQYDDHLFTKLDTDFLHRHLPDESGKVASFEVPGSGNQVICAARGNDSIGVIDGQVLENFIASRFFLSLLDSEQKRIEDLEVLVCLESNRVCPIETVDPSKGCTYKRPITKPSPLNRIVVAHFIHNKHISRFSKAVVIQPGESLTWYVRGDVDQLNNIKAVDFAGEFDIWVLRGTEFKWWDYSKGCFKGDGK